MFSLILGMQRYAFSGKLKIKNEIFFSPEVGKVRKSGRSVGVDLIINV